MTRVIHFSGGRTSAYMTILLKPTKDDIVLFTDTGREHPNTYQFILDFILNEGITVHTATYVHKKAPGLAGFDALIQNKAYLPNRTKRICTEELKVLTAKRWLRKRGLQHYESFIGFRADELDRFKKSKHTSKKIIVKYPLISLGITKEMVNQYWSKKPYTLDLPAILGNCDLCFLKGQNAIISILQVFPELADKWIKDEDSKFARRGFESTFIKGISYKQMLAIAQKLGPSKDKKLTNLLPAFSCSCRPS